MPYTPLIVPDDLTGSIYQEKLDAITRADDTILDKAIDSAISEVKSFLSRFNLTALFGDPVGDTAATVTDQFLKTILVDVACWKVVKLANVGIDLTLIRTGYEDAMSTLKRIQRIEQTPDGWPLRDLDTVTDMPGNPIAINSRKKRSNNSW